MRQMDFWRGMRNMEVPEEFLKQGGTELAPMSCTSDLAIAMQYSVCVVATQSNRV